MRLYTSQNMTKDNVFYVEPMEISSCPFDIITEIEDSGYYSIKLEKHIGECRKDVEIWYLEFVDQVLHQRMNMNISEALGQVSLHVAVRRQHTEMVGYLLSIGASVDATDGQGRTPLHVAASRGNLELAELLLSHGANPRASTPSGFTVLFFAVQSGNVELLRLLVGRGCDVNEYVDDREFDRQYTYLHNAVEMNNVVMVEALLNCNADANQRDCYGSTSLHLASQRGQLEVAKQLLAHGARIHERDRNGQSALCLAVGAGHQELFRLLTSHGADLNDKGAAGTGLLHLAVRQTDTSLLESLLSCGVDVDAVTNFGRTAVHSAIAERNWPALELLLLRGADVNRRESHGKTPLHLVVESRRHEVLDLLLRHGADPDARDNAHQTPLHAAVRQGCISSVETLLCHGADVNVRDNALRSPLHLAVRSSTASVHLLELLARHGADLEAVDAEGRATLHYAIATEHSRLAYIHPEHTFLAELLERGADVEAGRESTLHLAIAKRCPAFVRALLLRGADPQVRENGRSALHAAAENHDIESTEHLLACGAFLDSRDSQGRSVVDAMAGHPELLARSHRHLVRRNAAGLGSARPPAETEEALAEYRERCEEEVRRMSSSRLHEDATYLDLLRGGRRSLVVLAKSAEVGRDFKNQAHRAAFPIYADLLEHNYFLGRRFEGILEPAAETLEAVCGLPDLPLNKVLGYLNASDMRNLVTAVPSLPVRFET